MTGPGCSKVLQCVPKRCEEVPFNASLTADFLDGHAGRPKSHPTWPVAVGKPNGCLIHL